MSQLQENLLEILEQKNNLVKPENIKKGITLFDVEGAYISNITETSDYEICNNLAAQILGDLEIDLDDPNITINNILQINDNDSMNIEGNTLIIE